MARTHPCTTTSSWYARGAPGRLQAEKPSPSEKSLLVFGIRANSCGRDLAAAPERAIPANGR